MDKDFVNDLMKRVEEGSEKQNIHVPLSITQNREPDVEVEYVLDKADGLANSKPAQGMRCDFLYEGDDPLKDGTYSIAPELLDKNGEVIIDKTLPMPDKGKAYMWVDRGRNLEVVHKKRLKVGVTGFWVVGPYKLASVTITKIIGLHKC